MLHMVTPDVVITWTVIQWPVTLLCWYEVLETRHFYCKYFLYSCKTCILFVLSSEFLSKWICRTAERNALGADSCPLTCFLSYCSVIARKAATMAFLLIVHHSLGVLTIGKSCYCGFFFRPKDKLKCEWTLNKVSSYEIGALVHKLFILQWMYIFDVSIINQR